MTMSLINLLCIAAKRYLPESLQPDSFKPDAPMPDAPTPDAPTPDAPMTDAAMPNAAMPNALTSESHIPRPPNPYMIFRTLYLRHKKAHSRETMAVVSRSAGALWRNLTGTQKGVFQSRAEEIKAAHKLRFPWYVYSPRRDTVKAKAPVDESRPLRPSHRQTYPKQGKKAKTTPNASATKATLPSPSSSQSVGFAYAYPFEAPYFSSSTSTSPASSAIATPDSFPPVPLPFVSSNVQTPPQPLNFVPSHAGRNPGLNAQDLSSYFFAPQDVATKAYGSSLSTLLHNGQGSYAPLPSNVYHAQVAAQAPATSPSYSTEESGLHPTHTPSTFDCVPPWDLSNDLGLGGSGIRSRYPPPPGPPPGYLPPSYPPSAIQNATFPPEDVSSSFNPAGYFSPSASGTYHPQQSVPQNSANQRLQPFTEYHGEEAIVPSHSHLPFDVASQRFQTYYDVKTAETQNETFPAHTFHGEHYGSDSAYVPQQTSNDFNYMM